MKMLIVAYADYIDNSVTNAFKQSGSKSYLKLHDATGEYELPEACLPRTHETGKIKTILMAVPDEEIPRLLEIVRGLKTQYPTVVLRAFTFQIGDCIR